MSRGTRFQGNLDKRRALFQIFTTRESLLTYLAVGVQSEVIIGDLRLLVTSVYFWFIANSPYFSEIRQKKGY